MPKQNKNLKIAWDENKQFFEEAIKLCEKAEKLCRKAEKLFEDAVRKEYGDIEIDWSPESDCYLENGEVYRIPIIK